ncbi:MAG: sensor histidine kinase [Nitrososphaera sp.]
MALSEGSVSLLFVIGAIALILSLALIQYSDFISRQIVELAKDDLRRTAVIHSHDLGRLFANKIGSVTSSLEVAANLPTIQDNEIERARIAINAAQDSTSDLTNFYMWLDNEGKIVWISNINQTTYRTVKGTDLSYRPYFSETRENLKTYYSSVIDSNDNVARIYVAHPIVSQKTGEFLGIMSAGIRVDTLGTVLQSELLPKSGSSLGLLDREGTILYSANNTFVGKNVFGDEFQSLLPVEIKDSFNGYLMESLSGGSGEADFSVAETTSSIAYSPIVFDGEQFGTLYVVTPHQFASDIELLVNDQRNFSTAIVIVIAGVAIGIGLLVVMWSKRIEKVVDERTGELRAKSEELKRSYDSLSIANQQLEVHDRMQKEFINIAAHELRTPTQAILGYAELLRADPQERAEMIRAVYRNSLRLQRLTNDILDVTRIESDSLRLDKQDINIKNIVQTAVEDAMYQMAEQEIKLIYEPKDIMIKADGVRIAQVISNLLDNALKFTKQGSITVTTEKDDGRLILSVKDTGSGIDVDIMPRLFSKFATKSNRGTGLGLFISRSIIDAHGGSIWCGNNGEGRGATFGFSLPASDNFTQQDTMQVDLQVSE